MKHNYIGTEHLLLGLMRQEDGLAARVISRLGLELGEVRAEVIRIVSEGDVALVGRIPFTPRAKKVLELALREALSLGHNFIGTEHILLGLVRENEGVAARILLDFDADPTKVRDEIIRTLSGRGSQKVWRRSDVQVGQLWERAGRVFRVTAICDKPTVTIEDVATEMLEAFVIDSREFGEFVRLQKERP